MDCSEFLEGYSGFHDHRIGEAERRRYRAHLEHCGSCRRYHRVLRRGLRAVRDLPRVKASTDFFPRLQHRLFHLRDGTPVSPSRTAGSAAVIAVAAVGLLALAWLPFASRAPLEVRLPAVAVEAPPPSPQEPGALPSLFEPGPFVIPAIRRTAPHSRVPGWLTDGRRIELSSGYPSDWETRARPVARHHAAAGY